MTAPSNQQLLSNLRRFTRFASLVTIALGATVLTGWAADIASLTSIIPGMAKIEANAGLAFLFAGLALWLLRDGLTGDAANRLRFLPIALALFVSLVGILTLSQDWLGWSPGIDQFLFRDSGLPGAAHPGRMAPHSAISFVFLGLALAFLDYRTRRRFPPAQIPAVLAGGIAYLNLLVHVLRPFAPSRLASESAMSLQTAVIFAIFSAGVLAARAEGGLVGLFASDSPGGFLLRRFLPLMLIVPLPVSWLRLQGQKHGWWGLEFGVVIPAAATVLFFFILIVWTSKSLNRLDAARESALMTLRKSERSLRRLADRLQMLHKIDLNILEAQTPQEIAGAALKQIAALIPCDRTSLVLFPARGDQAEFLAVWERAPLGPPAGSTARMEDFTILENPPRERYVENLAAWPARTALLNELLRHGVRSVLTIPLTFAHQQIGELNFCSLPVAAFEPEHIEIAQELAAQLAVALHNARVREELRQSEGNFRSLFENSPLGIYRSSLEGKFLTVNPAMVQMLGYASEPELIALDMGKDIYADPKKREEMMRAEDVRQEFHDLEVEWRRMDGSVITVGLTGRPIVDADGTVEAFEVIAEDLTHRRLLEEQLRAAQKMEAIGRLAGGIAHDFNNLLNVIIGYCELLLDRVEDGKLRSQIEQVRKSGEHGAALTRQLLAFSRKQVLEPQVVDLNGIISDMSHILNRLIGEDIKLITVAATGVGKVKADPGQIEQVILNLAVNARDAMPQGGKITMETANVVLDDGYARTHVSVVPGHYVMLAVSDTGTGMDAEIQRRVFEPFFTTKKEGTGLGLATVYGIVKQSGGNIWVYSEPGKGTTFKIYFPKVDQPVETPRIMPSTSAIAGGSETILLVEDSDALREVAREFLEIGGYTVLEAPDAGAAMRMAEQCRTPIHMLLTDVVMPGMSGPALAEQLRRLHPETKALYVSGYTDDAIVHHGVLDAGVALLTKPFTRESLTRKVRQVLDSSETDYQ